MNRHIHIHERIFLTLAYSNYNIRRLHLLYAYVVVIQYGAYHQSGVKLRLVLLMLILKSQIFEVYSRIENDENGPKRYLQRNQPPMKRF